MSKIRACVTSWVAWATVAAIAAGAPPEDRQKTILLHGCDSAEGVSLSWGAICSEKHVRVNADANFVSQGQGSLHFAARSRADTEGNFYAGLMIPLDHVDVAARSIQFDCRTSTPDATQAVYLRLYGPGGRKVASWSNWGSPFLKSPRLEVRLHPGMGRAGFHWEAKNSDTAGSGDVVAAEIVIGTHDPDMPFDVYVDNLRMSARRRVPFGEITKAKELYIETPLVRAGRAEAIIVSPAGVEFAALARSVQAKIKELSGAELPILDVEAATPERLAGSHAILLGGVADNRAMTPVYAHLYTPVDAAYPAGDGYLVHTVHDPWGTGKNAVVLGGSTAGGTENGVRAFLETLDPGADLVLPKLNLFDLGDNEMKEIQKRAETLDDDEIQRQVETAKRDFARGAHRAVAGRMGRYGFEYSRSGNPMLARLYKELALAWHESYRQEPDTYGGPWGMDMDFHLMEILPAWDLLEESPALSDDDRLQVSRILHEFVTTDVVRKAAGTLTSTHVRHNHATFPALGLYFAGRYFQQGYDPPEAEYWLEIAAACFTRQALAAKPHEDCNGYGWLVPYHTMRYALATGDPTYFDNGNVRFQADYALLTMDNLGYQVPYGDTGSYQCWWTEIPFLRGAAFHHRDGRYAWALKKKAAVRPASAHYQYACGIEPVEPVDLLGVRAIPLDRSYWETFQGPETLPLERAVDKVVMRAGFAPQQQYLLLDGLSNGGHMHEDGNSISRITDRNRIWLADNDYIRSLPKFHNSMLVLRDGQAESMPAYCELLAVADSVAHGVAETVVRGYAGVDWRRAILWSKEKFFLVIDELVAREADDYDFHCFWHTVGDARLTDRGLEVEQKGPRFFIEHWPPVRLKLTDNVELGRNWGGYPHAEPVVRSLRQIQSASLPEGGRAMLANLLFASDDRRPQQYSIAGVDPRAVVVLSETEAMLGGVGDPEEAREVLPGLRIAARTFQITETSVLATDCRQLTWADFAFESEKPVTVDLSADAPETEVAGEFCLEGLDDALRAVERPTSTPEEKQAEPDCPVAGVVWSVGAEGKPLDPTDQEHSAQYLTIATGDLDGDGDDEIVAGSDDKHVYCFSADGQLRWKVAAAGRITTTAVASVDGSGGKYVAAGSEDCRVYALSPSGETKWSFEMPQYKRPGRVRVLLAA
ncbi:MAG: PQQ-like beta-propeller repeat protein, partial [Planctomycetes bacterium]|nr:PQQ-like beta-propeller repeat protein [Planctomycetota bacterium]